MRFLCLFLKGRTMPLSVHVSRCCRVTARCCRVAGCALALTLAVGCNETPPIQTETDPTTNPPGSSQTISPDAVEGDAPKVGETTHRDPGDSGPTQEQSLAGAYDLGEFKDKNRVLLVFAGSPQDKDYMKLKAAYQKRAAGADDRDLILVESLLRGKSPEAGKTLDEGESQVMRARYGVQPEAFHVVLVGKDGTAKAEGGVDLTLDDLFKQIDAMPMRQQELQK